MKRKSWIAVLITLLLIVTAIFAVTQSFKIGDAKNPKVQWTALVKQIKQGLDLKGGVLIVYEAQADKVTDQQMETTISIIEKRLASKGYFDASITRQGDKQIRVEIPGVEDTQKAINEIGKTAKLTLVDPDGKVIVDGKDVMDAKAAYGQTSSTGAMEHYISVKLNSSAQKAWAEGTERVSKLPSKQVKDEKSGESYSAPQNYISIKLDEDVISAPSVHGMIDSDTFIITGNFDENSAKELASLIRGGALPFKLDSVRYSEIGAKLGQDALTQALKAGVIGFIAVMIFMVAMYKVPGMVANISLLAYITLVLGILGSFGMTITLPGIAGIILSIGMAVDANVIIFARLKEELESGKSIRNAIDAAFSRAFSAIIDGNVTTLIAGCILLWLGSASIKGFAIVLIVGVITSLFTALVMTRFLLKHFVNIVGRNKKLYAYGKLD